MYQNNFAIAKINNVRKNAEINRNNFANAEKTMCEKIGINL